MSEEGKLVAEKEIEVNNYDIDAMGIVSNIVYVRWFEDLNSIYQSTYELFRDVEKSHLQY